MGFLDISLKTFEKATALEKIFTEFVLLQKMNF